MSRFWLLGCSVVLGSALLGFGCNSAGTGNGQQEQTATDEHGHDHEGEHSHDDHDHAEEGAANSEASDIERSLAQLSEEDQALARQQKVCPVSGEPLGSMGKPFKVEVEGKTVFLCCKGCEDAIKEEPEKYLAKIEQAGGEVSEN